MALRLDGVDELTRDLLSMAERAGEKAAEEALKAGARPIYQDMYRRTTIDPQIKTGNLHNSIALGSVRKTRRGRNSGYKTVNMISIGTLRAGLGNQARHAHLVEFGHAGPRASSKHTPAHPFVRPAFDANEEKAYQIMHDVLMTALLRHW